MSKNRDWQERGVRIGGRVLSEKEAQELVHEIRKRIRDPKVRKEVEGFLAGHRDGSDQPIRSFRACSSIWTGSPVRAIVKMR